MEAVGGGVAAVVRRDRPLGQPGGDGLTLAWPKAWESHIFAKVPIDTWRAAARLRELVPFCAPRNPVDCTAQVTNNLPLITEFTESVARDGGYPSILAFWTQVAAGSSVALPASLLSSPPTVSGPGPV